MCWAHGRNIIADLKQCIAATICQQVSGLRGDFTELRCGFDQLRTEMNERFDDPNAKVASIADAHSENISDYEKRTTSLEQHTAAA